MASCECNDFRTAPDDNQHEGPDCEVNYSSFTRPAEASSSRGWWSDCLSVILFVSRPGWLYHPPIRPYLVLFLLPVSLQPNCYKKNRRATPGTSQEAEEERAVEGEVEAELEGEVETEMETEEEGERGRGGCMDRGRGRW